jgi:hypothetical protein
MSSFVTDKQKSMIYEIIDNFNFNFIKLLFAAL